MTHTFLFQEGVWSTRGQYIDDTERVLPLVGIIRITHTESLWLYESETEISMEGKPVKICSRYEIIPPEEGKNQLTWKSQSPDLGELTGSYVVVGDAIISACRSKVGEYTGAEFYTIVSDTHYKNRGVFFKGNDKISSWNIDLLRK
ncbi:MAG TPA: hypothetical protein VLZ07_00110 [Syntrophales bacterium]|nr:hypothetical protein [Syntrophales bacterium]